MMKRWICSSLALLGAMALTVALPASAQVTSLPRTMHAPDYGSDASAGGLSSDNFTTPEADGRPGVKFYKQGMAAYHRKDYTHAVYMLKVAASWAYKPAEYNLGVIYFQGEGVTVDRPLGTAWMFLAAERKTPQYVYARHLMVASLAYDERTKALELLQQLKKTYSDRIALPHAKAQWAFTKARQTGTRVGGTVGELRVGVQTGSGTFHTPAGRLPAGIKHSWLNVISGGSVDGSVAYRQFQQSDNPYDPIFLKNRTGTVFVGPLQPVKPAHDKAKKQVQGASGSSPPSQLPHNG